MKERTMNGIPIREVWEKLKAEFPPEDVKKHPSTNMEYVSVEKIEQRLNEVVGMENWSFFVDAPKLYRFGASSYESCVVSGRLILYDDDRIPIVRSTCGASDIIYPKESDRPTSVANAFDSAVQDVFKRCAKRYGIAKKEKNSSHEQGRSYQPKVEKQMKVLVLEPFKALPKGGAKAKVKYDKKVLELVIWAKQWNELQNEYGESFQIGRKLNEITFFGEEKNYRGIPQLEFIRLPNNGKEIGAA